MRARSAASTQGADLAAQQAQASLQNGGAKQRNWAGSANKNTSSETDDPVEDTAQTFGAPKVLLAVWPSSSERC